MQKAIQNKMDGLLTVEVRNATNIPHDDNVRKFDPYVKLTLGKIELAKLPHATGLMAEQQRPSGGNVGPYRGWFYSAQSIIKRAPKSHVKKTRVRCRGRRGEETGSCMCCLMCLSSCVQKIASSDSPEWDEVFEFHITDGANNIIFAEVTRQTTRPLTATHMTCLSVCPNWMDAWMDGWMV